MPFITPSFINRVIRTGALAKARRRMLAGTACPPANSGWHRCSVWELTCEEVLDTEHGDEWYDGVLAELDRRGFTPDQIDAMRRFAWRTAGWLNYDKMLWEWVSLDEKDIKLALEWQLKDGVIGRREYEEGLAFVENPHERE
jgi:hypothetical protein